MKLETEKGQLMTTIFWRKPEAVDLSTSALTPSITASPRRNNPKYKTVSVESVEVEWIESGGSAVQVLNWELIYHYRL